MAQEATMSGAKLVGMVVAIQAMLLVLMEAYIDRPDVDEARAKQLLETFRTNGKNMAASLDHPVGQAETEKAVDAAIDTLTRNLPAMRGEFGLSGAVPARG